MATEEFIPDAATISHSAHSVVFEQFAHRLINLARFHLDLRLQHKIEPEDVVQSVYKSFLLRYGDRPLENEDAGGLWSLLTVITLRKCADRVRYHRAECRDIAREAAAPARADDIEAWREVVGREPTPEHAALLTETVERLLRQLDADERPILELSLQGFSTQEISQQLGRAERSVRRLRERVRKQLERMQTEQAI
jgi:RNA polymerase sigma-70 factor (ECF subfamily)